MQWATARSLGAVVGLNIIPGGDAVLERWVVVSLVPENSPEVSALAAFEDVSIWVAQPQRPMHNTVMEIHLIIVDD